MLLACLTAAVQIVTGSADGGPGYGPPIQVALLPAELEAIASSDDETPAPIDELDQHKAPDEPQTVAKAASPSEAENTEPVDPFEPPALVATPEPPADDQVAAAEPKALAEAENAAEPAAPEPLSTPIEAPLDEAAKPLVATDAATVVPGAPSQALDASEASQVSLPARPQLPAPYAARFAANRAELVAAGGGNAETEAAVRAALNWLAAAQSADGRWDAKKHGAGREYYVLGQDRNGAGAKADTGVSGLALLAFLGAGHTHH